MSDKREAILLAELKKAPIDSFPQGIYNAMDEYMKESVLEAFAFVALHTTGRSIDEDGTVMFKYKGEWISREQLFENFL